MTSWALNMIGMRKFWLSFTALYIMMDEKLLSIGLPRESNMEWIT
jgi:hypothetical protein